jgi:carbonic anhydrase
MAEAKGSRGQERAAGDTSRGDFMKAAGSGVVTAILGPAIEMVREPPGDPLDNAVRANVRRIVAELKASQPVLAELVRQKKLKIIGTHYALQSGKVEVIA